MKHIILLLLLLFVLKGSNAQMSDQQVLKLVTKMIKTFKPNNIPDVNSFKQFENSISSTSEYMNCQNEWSKVTNRYKNGYPKILRYKDSLDYTLKKLNYYIHLNDEQNDQGFEFKNLQINEIKKITKEDYFAGVVKQYFHNIYVLFYDSVNSNKYAFKIKLLESNNTIILLSTAEDVRKDFVKTNTLQSLIDSNAE